jgi:hypothetical protein
MAGADDVECDAYRLTLVASLFVKLTFAASDATGLRSRLGRG